MRKKILLSIATILVITSGVLAPVFELITSIATPVAFAQAQYDADGNLMDLTPEEKAAQLAAIEQKLEAAKTPSSIATQSETLECGTNFVCGMVMLIGAIFTFSSNLLATVSGLILDFSLWYSIQSSTYGMLNPFLESGWKLIRDFTNLLFIFALLVVGFMLIFDTDANADSYVRLDPKRTVAYVIIMALLVNFSFFISRSVIEIGNVTATIIYSSIGGVGASETDGSVTTQNQTDTSLGSPSTWFTSNTFSGMKSISLGILNKVNPQELILDNSKISTTTGWFGWKSYDIGFYVLYIFLAIIVAVTNLALVYIFISMAILFIGRTIGLAFILILSPIAFVSVTIPKLKGMDYIGFDDWILELIGLTFVAPIYLFFVYLTIMFLNTNLFDASGSGYLLIATVILIKLMFVLLVLLRGKSLAVSMSGHIGKMVGGVMNSVGMLAVGAATAGTGLAMSQTFGRVGSMVGSSGRLQLMSEKKAANDIQSEKDRQKWAGRIRKFGAGRYSPIKGMATNLANNVATGELSSGRLQAKAAGGIRNMGKSVATANVFDMGAGKATGRNVLAALANKTGNQGLSRGLAQDFVSNPITGIQATMAKNRMMDIEASKNAKKVAADDAKKRNFTNAIGGAMTAGLNSGGSTPTTGTAGANQSNQGTGALPQPNPTNQSTTPGQTTTTAPRNNFNGTVDFDRPRGGPGGPDDLRNPTPDADRAQREESERLAGLYDREKQQQKNDLQVENLTVQNLKIASDNGPKPSGLVDPSGNPVSSRDLVDRPQNRASSLLQGIQGGSTARSGALDYKPTDLETRKPVQSLGTPMENKSSYSPEQQARVDGIDNQLRTLEDQLNNANLRKDERVSLEEKFNQLEKSKNSIAFEQPVDSLDQSNLVLENLPGENGNFDFGGMGPRPDTDE